jgi:Sec-independent protein translocase protein TatA
MFDLALEPWLICGLVALIILRPDDWTKIAYAAGKWMSYIQSYAHEWRQYLSAGLNQTPAHQDLQQTSALDIKVMHWPRIYMPGVYKFTSMPKM